MATMSKAELEAEIAAVTLQTAQLNLERAKADNERYLAEKTSKGLINQQRQEQMKLEVRNQANVSAGCVHRQGGSPYNPFQGKGDTSLKVVILPDNFASYLIMCSNCRLRAYTPHPLDKDPEPRKLKHSGKMETKEQVEERVKRYKAQKAYTDDLLEQAQDSISDEYAQPMDTGVKIEVTDYRGLPVFRERPCDSHPRA